MGGKKHLFTHKAKARSTHRVSSPSFSCSPVDNKKKKFVLFVRFIIMSHNIEALQKTLTDDKEPLAKRFRAIFLLKSIGSIEALNALGSGLLLPPPFPKEKIIPRKISPFHIHFFFLALFEDESALLRHEVAYCIGQIQLPEAIPILHKSLESDSNSMVRHEVCKSLPSSRILLPLPKPLLAYPTIKNNTIKQKAGEALGAIGTQECLDILEKYLNDPSVEVRETCEIAVAAVRWKLEHPEEKDKAFPSCEMFSSIDPAPPSKQKDVEALKKELVDVEANLFDRYKAMFSLRNLATEEAVLVCFCYIILIISILFCVMMILEFYIFLEESVLFYYLLLIEF